MELSVRPDDLAASASALRQAHTALARGLAEFEATALRLAPHLGPHAAQTARESVLTAVRGSDQVADDLATFARGLAGAAAYYAAVDEGALGRRNVTG